MQTIKSYGPHPYQDRLTFVTHVRFKTNRIQAYTPAKMTPKQVRVLQKEVRLMWQEKNK